MAQDMPKAGEALGLEGSSLAAIAKLLRVDLDRLEPDVSLAEDLKVDSLDFIALIVGLERHFDVSFPDVEAAQIKTISELIKLVLTYVPSEQPATAAS